MIKRLVLIFLVVCFVVPIVSSQDESVDSLRSERFLLTFVPNIQFAPLYVASAKGYFADVGMDITVEYLNEPDVIDLVAVGQANFGMVSGEQTIIAAAQERPIVYIYEWFQEYPIGIVVDAASDIQSVTDLVGKRVGLPGRFGATYSGLVTLLLANNLTESDIELQEIGYSAPDVFCIDGAIDAATIYINNEPLQIQARADDNMCGNVENVRVISVGSVTDLVSNGIITSESLIESDPDDVADMITAFEAGLRDTINNPAEAYLLSVDYIEGLPLSAELTEVLKRLSAEQNEFLATQPTREEIMASRTDLFDALADEINDPSELIQFQVLLESIAMWDAEVLGYTELTSWQAMQDTLLELGSLTEPVNLEAIFTNEFLPVGE